MKQSSQNTVAVVGAGIAGAACAAGLRKAGMAVSVFDKSRGVGGRTATRRVTVTGGALAGQTLAFDHGAQTIVARRPRMRAMLARAQAAGVAAPWQPLVHSAWPSPAHRDVWVATPGMPALARHLIGELPTRLSSSVQRLQRSRQGWHVVLAGEEVVGPFQHVVLALPPAQAALLLAGHHDQWADQLAAVPMHPCWTLMAASDDVDFPWDAVEPDRGPLAWIARNDRKPGRETPSGIATWVAHATPAWSADHLEADPQQVAQALRDALAACLPPRRTGEPALTWHHAGAHRWRYASPVERVLDGQECWWDGEQGVGVCGDFFTGGDVEAAWRSGDELADTLSAWLEEAQELAEAA